MKIRNMSLDQILVDEKFEYEIRNFLNRMQIRGTLKKINPVCYEFSKRKRPFSYFFHFCGENNFIFTYVDYVYRFESFEKASYNLGLAIHLC